MKTEFIFNDVISRCKEALKIKNDIDLAARLGMKPTTFNSRKKAGSLPFEEIIVLANTENLDFNWLLTGEGYMYRNANQVQDLKASYGVKAEAKSSLLDDVKILERFANLEKRIYELEHWHS